MNLSFNCSSTGIAIRIGDGRISRAGIDVDGMNNGEGESES